MGKITIEVETKRPKSATPDRIRELRKAGLTLKEIGQRFGISKQRVWKLSQPMSPSIVPTDQTPSIMPPDEKG